jgi:hypothetical protein
MLLDGSSPHFTLNTEEIDEAMSRERCQEALPCHMTTDATPRWLDWWDWRLGTHRYCGTECDVSTYMRSEEERRKWDEIVAKYSEIFELTQEQPALLLHVTTGHSNKHNARCSTLVEPHLLVQLFGCNFEMILMKIRHASEWLNCVQYHKQSSQGQHNSVQYNKWDRRFDNQDRKRINLELWNVSWLNIRSDCKSSRKNRIDNRSRNAFQIL